MSGQIKIELKYFLHFKLEMCIRDSRNTSGSGFDLVILVPSQTASKYPVSTSLLKISLVCMLEDPIANFRPRLRRVSIERSGQNIVRSFA